MDPWKQLLRNGWITLLAALAVVVMLALLPTRAGAVDVDPGTNSTGTITELS